MAIIECSTCSKKVSIVKQRVRSKNYCSRKCYSVARENKRTTNCIICLAEIRVKRSSVGKYCSRECAAIGYIATGKEKKLKECTVCKTVFMQAFFMDSTCSTQCEIIYKNIQPLFMYKLEYNEAEKVDEIYLRNVDPSLGF